MARGRKKQATNDIPDKGIAPTAPDWLNEVARKEWDRILPEVFAAYVITPMDAVNLAAYCCTFAKWRQCEERVAAEGIIREDGKIHPLERHSLYLVQEVRRMAGEFGLSPAARKSLNPKPESDELDSFV